jgi:hypothetical protein
MVTRTNLIIEQKGRRIIVLTLDEYQKREKRRYWIKKLKNLFK